MGAFDMTAARKYRLLCPIARALDVLGDRWALLVLRDLHAGPARFSDLQLGLAGIATNLLASRLSDLVEAQLIRKADGPYGVALYELTELGRSTAPVLFELARFGSRLPPDPDVRRPGNLRSVAVTLSVACTRVVDPKLTLQAELRIAGEPFTVEARRGKVEIVAGPCKEAEVVIETEYEPMIAVTDGELEVEAFVQRHVQIVSGEMARVSVLLNLMGKAAAFISSGASPPDPKGPRG